MILNRRKISATIIALLLFASVPKAFAATSYTVKSGDSLWLISRTHNVTVQAIKDANKLATDSIFIGQTLIIPTTTTTSTAPTSPTTTTSNTTTATQTYTVKSGDTLWLISKAYGVTIDSIRNTNKLTSDMLYIGQVLSIPSTATPQTPQTPTTPTTSLRPGEGVSWSSLQSYIVQAGEYGTTISKKFNVPVADLLKYNYMTENDWFYAGQKIAINGYAPRQYSAVPGESSTALNYGKLVDWYLDGQYYLKRDVLVQITDINTGLSFKAKVLGGINHPDLEPVDSANTEIMKKIFPVWDWTPRPVVLYYNGMNMAASLSGMPHSFDSTPTNEVSGHFDCYLTNSTPHSSTTSKTYIQQHYTNIQIASQSR
jgi:peptidoglycan DL-endopeptidase CwlS